MSEPNLEPEFVRPPDHERGEKAMYPLAEVIGTFEDLRVANERVERLEGEIGTFREELRKLEAIATAGLEQSHSVALHQALLDIVGNLNRISNR